MGINVAPGTFTNAYSPIALGAEGATAGLADVAEGQRVREQTEYNRSLQAQQQARLDHAQAIQDMAHLAELYGQDVVNVPEFKDAYQRAFKAAYPMMQQREQVSPEMQIPGQPGQPSAYQPGQAPMDARGLASAAAAAAAGTQQMPGTAPRTIQAQYKTTQVPIPLGGVDKTPTLGSLGLTNLPANVQNLTTRQAAQLFGPHAVGQMILEQNRMTEGQYEAQLIQKYNTDPNSLNPQELEYAKGLRGKKMGEQSAAGVLLNWQMSHPNEDISTAPRFVQDIYQHEYGQRNQEEQAIANVRTKGLANVSPEDRMIYQKKFGTDPQAVSMDRLKSEYVADPSAYRAKHGDESANLMERIVNPQKAGQGPNLEHLYLNWQTRERAVGDARLNLASAIRRVDNINQGREKFADNKSRGIALTKANAELARADAAMQRAVEDRNHDYSVYDVANQMAGGPGAGPRGGVGTPPGRTTTVPGRTGVSRELIDKGTQGLLETALRKQNQKLISGLEATIPGKGVAVYDGTDWRWK